MAARVPYMPRAVSAASVKSALPVRGAHWVEFALQANYLIGRGCTLIPAYNPNVQIATSTAQNFYYRWYPHRQGYERRWCIGLSAASATAGVETLVTLPSAEDYGLVVRGNVPTIYEFQEVVSSPGIGPASATLNISNQNSSTALNVDHIACYEYPRASLLQTEGASGERGVDPETCATGTAIYDDLCESVGGVAEAVDHMLGEVRRATLHAWSVPQVDAVTSTSGTYANLFTVDPIVLARIGYHASGSVPTSRTVTALARVTSGDASTTVAVKCSANSGDSVELTSSTGSYEWQSGTVDIDCESQADGQGYQSGTRETVAWEIRRSAGTTGTCAVSAVLLCEHD